MTQREHHFVHFFPINLKNKNAQHFGDYIFLAISTKTCIFAHYLYNSDRKNEDI